MGGVHGEVDCLEDDLCFGLDEGMCVKRVHVHSELRGTLVRSYIFISTYLGLF